MSQCGEYLSKGRAAEGHSEWRQINELETPASLLLGVRAHTITLALTHTPTHTPKTYYSYCSDMIGPPLFPSSCLPLNLSVITSVAETQSHCYTRSIVRIPIQFDHFKRPITSNIKIHISVF